MNKIVLLLGIITLFGNISLAQDDKSVTLTVSGQGKTQDEAKQNALRNAIEQAFGAFISSNTEILNDNLVRDEIVSVSNGNIQDFEVISEVQIPNGGYATTLKAIVSVSKLTSFIESKGAVADLKGSLLAANIRQQMLNEENENKSIANVTSVCKKILDRSCDFVIVRGEPKQKNDDNNKWSVPIIINVSFNKNIEQFRNYLLYSIKGISMTPEEVTHYQQLGKKTYKIALDNGVNNENESSGVLRLTGKDKNFGKEQIQFLRKNIPNSSSNSILYQLVFSKNGIVNENIIFESTDINIIENEIRTQYSNNQYWIHSGISIRYMDISAKPIYHFRSLVSVVSIIDLIYYTKNAVLNFNINNGIDTITPAILVKDKENSSSRHTRMNARGYGVKIIYYNLTPIFNARCNWANHKATKNGPLGIFANGNNCDTREVTVLSLYEAVREYDNNHYYNGGRYESGFETVYNEKYGFLLKADSDLPKSIRGANYEDKLGYYAVISLYDFYRYNINILSIYFEDILSLSDLERITEYRIY